MKKLNNRGSAILYLIVTLPILISIAINYMGFAAVTFRLAKKDQNITHAQLAADAGIDAGMELINLDDTWSGTGIEFTMHDDSETCTTFHVTVNDIDSDTKIMTSIGRTYKRDCPAPADTSKAIANVKLEATLRSSTSGDFSIVAGVGGLELENHAKVLGGDVHVNGRVSMKNHAQIGLALAPANLTVANQTCPVPADANYPRLCNSGENNDPISIINDAHIYGDVKANHQTNSYPLAMTNPGLTASSGVAVQPLPAHDRVAQIGAVTTTRTGADASCTSNNGVKTWEANTKIIGDVTISGNTTRPCIVTLKGDVWITGKLVIENGGTLAVSNLVLTGRPNVMIDNKITEFKNAASIQANALGIGVQFINYWSTNSCTYAEINPCASISGTDLNNSKSEVTIKLDNSATGSKAIFYSKFTKVLVANSGNVGALVGQTVHLQNSGAVTFGSSVAGGLSFWLIDGYRRTF